jgi:hypothetical protein
MDRSTPSEQGVAPEGIAAFLDAVEGDGRIEPHGLIIQRHGQRIAEGYWAPHRPGQLRLVYSLSKTFTGTALALQIGGPAGCRSATSPRWRPVTIARPSSRRR